MPFYRGNDGFFYQLGSRAGAEAAAQPPRSGIGRERVSTWQSVLLMSTDIPIASASGRWGVFPPAPRASRRRGRGLRGGALGRLRPSLIAQE